ncbi:hypothetical protein BT96DRAFT_999349 [Gymnopus androsaceus JB14]|uniref:Uncharacterized protein n=1 Tax=Gymnopus androsaceus JB14 TaxID=1447944 RepID=A0A6A4H745_9AGAR|nr:hypothetical protein BT96DRAFT_999349 [Gymnopus androsaceus JB14]
MLLQEFFPDLNMSGTSSATRTTFTAHRIVRLLENLVAPEDGIVSSSGTAQDLNWNAFGLGATQSTSTEPPEFQPYHAATHSISHPLPHTPFKLASAPDFVCREMESTHALGAAYCCFHWLLAVELGWVKVSFLDLAFFEVPFLVSPPHPPHSPPLLPSPCAISHFLPNGATEDSWNTWSARVKYERHTIALVASKALPNPEVLGVCIGSGFELHAQLLREQSFAPGPSTIPPPLLHSSAPSLLLLPSTPMCSESSNLLSDRFFPSCVYRDVEILGYCFGRLLKEALGGLASVASTSISGRSRCHSSSDRPLSLDLQLIRIVPP